MEGCTLSAEQPVRSGQLACKDLLRQTHIHESECVCRLCFTEEKDGLVAPCSCRGSLQLIHVECLQRWQRMLWQARQYHRAFYCDVCRQPYHQQYAACPLQQQTCLIGRAQQWVQQLYARPELAFKAWRYCVVLGGVAVGTHRGMSGFKAGISAGMKTAKPLAAFTIKLMPQLSILAAALPHLQPLLRSMLRCSFAVMAAEVMLAGTAGLFCGGLLGFCLGTVGVVRLTADCSCRAASLAALLAARLAKSTFKMETKGLTSALLRLRAPC